MDLLTYLIIGAIAGTLANFIYPSPSKGGILGSIVLGILGALVGGYLGSLLGVGGVTGFNATSVVLAVAGSLLLLYIGRFFTRASY